MRFDSVGLYLHLPFCVSKCAYCDFNSFSGLGDLIPEYLRALKAEMAGRSAGGAAVATVFVGGGTPTALSGPELAGLLEDARRCFTWLDGTEATVEANPGTVDRAKLSLVRQAGANRLSLGVQSFNDRLLVRLGRVHRAAEAREAVRAAREAGFDNLSLDLIFGLPGQTLADWRADLESALELEPEHLSCYSLKVEEGTSFAAEAAAGRLDLPGEETDLAMFDLTRDRLGAAGYESYEISNFARPGRRCRHNLVYWRNEEYLGFGAGAASYLDRRRWTNIRDPREYVRALDRAAGPTGIAGGFDHGRLAGEVETTDLRTEMIETVMMSLRTSDGLSEDYFRRRFGAELRSVFPEALDWTISRGLSAFDEGALRLTPTGLRLANQALAAFV